MKLIDNDFHIHWKTEEDIAAYLPKVWQNRFLYGAGHTQNGLPVSQPVYNPLDKADTCGWRSPAEALSCMDEHGISKALLTNYHAPTVGVFGDRNYPALLAEAYNRWLIDEWLSHSPRFMGAITVAPQTPEKAKEEIERAASHPQVVAVMISAGTLQPYGKPFFKPIFQAAVEHNLPVIIHSGTEGVSVSNPPSTHGWPRNLLEYRVCPVTNFIAHYTSMLTEGLWTDFPDLKLIGLETGGFLPFLTYLWRFDKNYKALRSECPWVKELPSVIAKKTIRFGTQSTAIGKEEVYFSLMESFGADDVLLWSSNQPRWDSITPTTDPHLSRQGRWSIDKVASTNAEALYRHT